MRILIIFTFLKICNYLLLVFGATSYCGWEQTQIYDHILLENFIWTYEIYITLKKISRPCQICKPQLFIPAKLVEILQFEICILKKLKIQFCNEKRVVSYKMLFTVWRNAIWCLTQKLIDFDFILMIFWLPVDAIFHPKTLFLYHITWKCQVLCDSSIEEWKSDVLALM